MYLIPRKTKKIKRMTSSNIKEIKIEDTLEITNIVLGKLRFFTNSAFLVITSKALVVEVVKKFQSTIPTKR